MTRRDKHEMYMMKKVVTVFLERNEMKPLQAFEGMVSHYLSKGEQIPYYIKSVKDFQKVAKEIAEQDKLKNMDAEQRSRSMNISNKVKSFIMESDVSTLKEFRKNFNSVMSENEKIVIVELIVSKVTNELKEKDIDTPHINLFKKHLVFE